MFLIGARVFLHPPLLAVPQHEPGPAKTRRAPSRLGRDVRCFVQTGTRSMSTAESLITVPPLPPPPTASSSFVESGSVAGLPSGSPDGSGVAVPVCGGLHEEALPRVRQEGKSAAGLAGGEGLAQAHGRVRTVVLLLHRGLFFY